MAIIILDVEDIIKKYVDKRLEDLSEVKMKDEYEYSEVCGRKEEIKLLLEAFSKKGFVDKNNPLSD